MRGNLLHFVNSVGQRFLLEDQDFKSRVPDLAEALADAHQEWQAAQNYFENVSDPELVDHAIYLLEAAEKKYTYLLRQVRLTNGKNQGPSAGSTPT